MDELMLALGSVSDGPAQVLEPGSGGRVVERRDDGGGRLVVYTMSASLAGTPAAPEPIVRYMHFYAPDELLRFADEAGLQRAEVADLGGAHLLIAVA